MIVKQQTDATPKRTFNFAAYDRRGREPGIIPANATINEKMVSCKSKRCLRCKDAPSHGPYLYAYFWENGKTRCVYLGKKEVNNNLPKS
jgi:hypothetical protein